MQIRSALALGAVLASIFSAPSHAQRVKPQPPTIAEVVSSSSSGTLMIAGANLASVTITLGDDPTPLEIVSQGATGQEVLARLPAGLTSGDYLLTVSNVGGSARWPLTYAAVDYEVVVSRLWDLEFVNLAVTGTVSADCPAGTRVVSGGFRFTLASPAVFVVTGSYPSSATRWSVDVRTIASTVPQTGQMTVRAVCVRVP